MDASHCEVVVCPAQAAAAEAELQLTVEPVSSRKRPGSASRESAREVEAIAETIAVESRQVATTQDASGLERRYDEKDSETNIRTHNLMTPTNNTGMIAALGDPNENEDWSFLDDEDPEIPPEEAQELPSPEPDVPRRSAKPRRHPGNPTKAA